MTAVRYVLRLRRGGCLWGGLPCSAHVWIASGTTGKSPSFPRGDMSVPCTRKGNCLAARFCLLALLAIARQVYWGGEQPGTSVAILLDYVEWVMNCNRSMIGFLPSTTVRFWMGLFGHRSLKRSYVFGSLPWLHMISVQSKVTEQDRQKFKWNSSGVVKKTIKKVKGKKDHVNVSGGPRLTQTGEYPYGFCRKLAAYHKKWCTESCLANQKPEIK
ncbi:unnamed protein product [Cladocopium goreaui]|uniref:Rhamnose biosynthetic enzyme 1 n=1 Tax=Cladocopium goreaui TaxID=2562237 RepID=A0A9P1FTX7_9DINO|nr:unnamed protein product [Cladocopium goreaui]